MGARDRIGDKNWDTYIDKVFLRKCDCGQGEIYEEVLIASHEKTLRDEREFMGCIVNCKNPNCPSNK